jgi:hypothetical protein
MSAEDDSLYDPASIYDYAPVGGLDIDPSMFTGGLDLSKLSLPDLQSLFSSDAFDAFAAQNPEDAAILQSILARDIDDATLTSDAASGVYDPNDQSAAETARLQRQAGNEGDGSLKATGVPVGDPDDPTGIKKLAAITPNNSIKKRIADALGVEEDTLGDMAKYATALGIAKLARDDAEAARKEARGASFKASAPVTATRTAYKGTKYSAAGGLASLAGGGKTDLPPRYLDGHTDGMADNVPAHIDRKRPAALSDGEFVIPADVVSHLGNGNSNAGAKRLYEMMDRIRSARTGNSKQGKQINPNRFLPR